MKILIVADEESKYIWDYYDQKMFDEISFIISAGDLKAKYLSFLTTVARKYVFYVYGNHDHKYEADPPEGCEPIDDRIVYYQGLRILGLGGSFRYKDGPYQYTEREMKRRIRKLRLMIDQFGGFDILVTHSPARGFGDGEDLCHTGFESFIDLIQKYKPSYMLHGHQHLNYSRKIQRIQHLDQTTIVNGYSYHILDYHGNGFQYPSLSGLRKQLNSLRFHLRYQGSDTMKAYRRYKKDRAKK
ncbi:MAG: metallophosphoesterase [Vallitaleaceae bacterium]|nr:metallophosphoesterase [Vallitaleaceae bacterium]